MKVEEIIANYNVSRKMAEHLHKTPLVDSDLYLKNQRFILLQLADLNLDFVEDFDGAKQYLQDRREAA